MYLFIQKVCLNLCFHFIGKSSCIYWKKLSISIICIVIYPSVFYIIIRIVFSLTVTLYTLVAKANVKDGHLILDFRYPAILRLAVSSLKMFTFVPANSCS